VLSGLTFRRTRTVYVAGEEKKSMATKAKAKSGTKRTKVKSLPKSTKELSGKSMKKIKGPPGLG
jgi:hypothetical protein